MPERVIVTGPDGAGVEFDTMKEAREFVKNNPRYSVGETAPADGAESEAKAMDQAEDKAVRGPRNRAG